MKMFFSAIAICFSTCYSFGQIHIYGKILDDQNQPLFGVNVYVKGTYDGTSTNEEGAFGFTTNVTGLQTISASLIGYKALEHPVELVGDSLHLSIILKEAINKMDGITISAGAFEAGDKKKSVVLRTMDIVTTAGATADITGVMNTLPGTQTVGEEGRLFVRGGAGHEAKTFINGMLVANPYGITPQNTPTRFRFSPFLFKGAFFSTGGYSAEFGQALSSVLQLKTYDLPARSQTDVSLMSVGAGISQTIRGNATSVFGEVQYTDLTPYYALVPQRDEWERAPKSLNSTLHVKQRYGQHGSVQLYTNFDKSDMTVRQTALGNIYETMRLKLSSENLYSNLSIQNNWGEKVSYRGGLGFTNASNTIILDSITVENKIISLHAKLVIDHDISDNIQLKYGGEMINDQYTESIFNVSEIAISEIDVESEIFSPFVEASIYFSNRLMARIGGRYEYHVQSGHGRLSPRLSLAQKVGEYGQVSLAYGKFIQLPTHEKLKLDPDLSSEEATHFIGNYQYVYDGRIFRSEIYYKKYEHLVTSSFHATDHFQLDNSGYGEAKGIELFWRDSKTIKAVDYWVSYSYLDTQRKYDHFPYPVIPYFATKHNLSIVYKQFLSSIKSQIGWTYSFTSGRPYTDPNNTGWNSKLTKNYHDLSINYSYLVKPNMILHASISNVLGFNNVFGYQFNSTPNENGIYESIPVIPAAKRFILIGFFFTISKDKNANQLNNL